MTMNPFPSSSLLRVNHISLVVRNAKISARFYHEILGAEPLNRPAFRFPGFWLWLGNVQLHLIQALHEDDVPGQLRRARGLGAGGANHFALEIANFDAVETFLREKGVSYQRAFVPAGRRGFPALRQVFFPDPDGHLVEVCECDRLQDFVFGGDRAREEANRIPDHLVGLDLHAPGFLVLLVGLFTIQKLLNRSSTDVEFSPSTEFHASSAEMVSPLYFQGILYFFQHLITTTTNSTTTNSTTTNSTPTNSTTTNSTTCSSIQSVLPSPPLLIDDLVTFLMRFFRSGPFYSTPFRPSPSPHVAPFRPHSLPSAPDCPSSTPAEGLLLADPSLVAQSLRTQLLPFAADGSTLRQSEFEQIICCALSSCTVDEDLLSSFLLLCSDPNRSDSPTINYLDFVLIMSRLQMDDSDEALRSQFAHLSNPDQLESGISLHQFQSLFLI